MQQLIEVTCDIDAVLLSSHGESQGGTSECDWLTDWLTTFFLLIVDYLFSLFHYGKCMHAV